MKQFLMCTSIVCLALFGNSCRQELEDLKQQKNVSVQVKDGTVVNGRLYFSSIESLQNAYDEIKDEEDEIIANYLKDKDFMSLRPIITEENEKLMVNQMSERLNSLKSEKIIISNNLTLEDIEDDLDDLEEIIGDDVYSAFLNSDAEIQVANKIYKYTDVGLFIVKDDKYSELQNYLKVNNISDNLLLPTNTSIKENFVLSNANTNGVKQIDANIEYFIENPEFYSPGTVAKDFIIEEPENSKLPVKGGADIYNDEVYKFVESLQSCKPRKGLFGDLFGQNNVCIDQYEKRRRVKVKAFNYNYYLVYHLGVKVKHQYRGWTGGWRKETADEIRIGVTSAIFIYDYGQYFRTTPPNNRKTTIYNNNSRLVFDANVRWEPGFYPHSYSITSYDIKNYPKILKDDIYIEDILGRNFYSDNAILDKAIYNAMKAGNSHLTSQYLNQKFWKESINYLGQTWIKLGRKVPDNNITYSLCIPELGKLCIHKAFYRNNYNSAKVEKTFDWGFNVGININPEGSISPEISGGSMKKPQDFKVNLYGIVKKNGKWHGIKMNTF